MTAAFFVVPQWQGSGSSRALRLVDGAETIANELPAAATERVSVPLEAGDSEGTGIHRFSAIRLVREALARSLADREAAHEPGTESATPVVIGGDCGVAPAVIEHAARDGRIVLLWADAHGDLHDAASSPSGAFGGMALRTVLDEGLVAAADVVLLGARDLEPAELDLLSDRGIAHVPPGEALVERLAAALERAAAPRSADNGDGDSAESDGGSRGAVAVHIHVDLDVLDPAALQSVAAPTPFGLTLDELLGSIAAARAALPLRAASVCGFAPDLAEEAGESGSTAPGDDLTTILRILGALRR